MNEYLTLDLAAGIPIKLGDNSEALVALSPFSINLSVDGNIGLATLLKFRYGKIFLESKLVLTEYKEKSGDPFFLNNSLWDQARIRKCHWRRDPLHILFTELQYAGIFYFEWV